MYRPLYWFGNGDVADDQLLAEPGGARRSGQSNSKSVTITLKPYKWSNGETVDATDVLFWMNMFKVEKDNFGGYVPGYIPDNVASVKAHRLHDQVQFNLTKAYNHNWFLYNELPTITPMPDAWDRTASGPSDCAKDASDCAAVYNYLIAQNRDLSTYATSPVWAVVDGPWKLSAFNSDGALTMVQNPTYSGPSPRARPRRSRSSRRCRSPPTPPSTTCSSRAPARSRWAISRPRTSPGTRPTSTTAGPNPLSPDYNAGPVGHLLGVTTSRSTSTTRPSGRSSSSSTSGRRCSPRSTPHAIIKNVFHGYAYQTTNGVPTCRSSSLLAPGLANDQFPFSISKAKSLLTANGWDVNTDPGTCVKPGTGAGECGAGITQGEKLSFSLKYASGTAFLTTEFHALQSDAGLAGIQLNLSEQAGQEITANDSRARRPSRPRAPGRWATGAPAGCSPRTTTRRVRTCS